MSASIPAPKSLPLVHSTTCSEFPAIASSGALQPNLCPIFSEPLIYFFYGRPAYYPRRVGRMPSTKITYCPICFVFRPQAATQIARVYPCDSGALQRGNFAEHIPPADRDKYELSGGLEYARRLVAAFFDSNGSYYLGKAREGLTFLAADQDSPRYYGLITCPRDVSYDERRSAIEVQTRQAIGLSDQLHAVILPGRFLDEGSVRETIVEQWGALPLLYDTQNGTAPYLYKRDVQIKLKDLLENGGYL